MNLPALAALLDRATEADTRETGDEAVVAPLALLLGGRRRVLLVLHGRLLRVVVGLLGLAAVALVVALRRRRGAVSLRRAVRLYVREQVSDLGVASSLWAFGREGERRTGWGC